MEQRTKQGSGYETRTGSYLEKLIRYLGCERNNDWNKKENLHNQCITNGHRSREIHLTVTRA